MVDLGFAEYLQQQFESHQRDEGALSHSAAARASSMKKQISVLALNNSVSKMSLQQGSDASTDGEALTSLLLQYVDSSMAVDISSDNKEVVEQVLDLVSALATISSEEATEAVAARAMEYSTVLLERVRGQACLLMGFLAYHLSAQNEQWMQEWFEALKESIMPRLTDKSQSVRNCAIRASAKFFFGDDGSSDDLLEMLLWNVWHDPSVVNRVAAVEALPVTKDTVDHIITRVRDVKEKVRVQALAVLRNRVDPQTDLEHQHFAEIIQSGLSVR